MPNCACVKLWLNNDFHLSWENGGSTKFLKLTTQNNDYTWSPG